MTLLLKEQPNPIECLPAAPNTGCSSAKTTPTSDSPPSPNLRGLVDSHRIQRTRDKQEQLDQAKALAHSTSHDGMRIDKWLRRPDSSVGNLPEDIRIKFSADVWNLVETDFKYGGYVQRQLDQIERTKKMEDRVLPTLSITRKSPGSSARPIEASRNSTANPRSGRQNSRGHTRRHFPSHGVVGEGEVRSFDAT